MIPPFIILTEIYTRKNEKDTTTIKSLFTPPDVDL